MVNTKLAKRRDEWVGLLVVFVGLLAGAVLFQFWLRGPCLFTCVICVSLREGGPPRNIGWTESRAGEIEVGEGGREEEGREKETGWPMVSVRQKYSLRDR